MMTARDARKLAASARSLSDFAVLYRDPECQCHEIGIPMAAQHDLDRIQRQGKYLASLLDDYLGLVLQDK